MAEGEEIKDIATDFIDISEDWSNKLAKFQTISSFLKDNPIEGFVDFEDPEYKHIQIKRFYRRISDNIEYIECDSRVHKERPISDQAWLDFVGKVNNLHCLLYCRRITVPVSVDAEDYYALEVDYGRGCRLKIESDEFFCYLYDTSQNFGQGLYIQADDMNSLENVWGGKFTVGINNDTLMESVVDGDTDLCFKYEFN